MDLEGRLWPALGRGRTPFTDKAALRTAGEAILAQREVTGLLRLQLTADVERRAVRAYAGQQARVD